MPKGKLILLNGGSSNGKTSTCEAIQDKMPEHFIRLGIDRFWSAMPPRQVNLKTTEEHYMGHYSFEKDGKPYFQIIPGIELDRAMYGSYRAIKAYLDFGMNVISDQIFWKKEWLHECLDVLHENHVFLVGMRVSDEEGTRRENERRTNNNTITQIIGMWPDGWHRNTALITHQDMMYDYEIDNTELSIEETADNIIHAFNECREPAAFKALYQQINKDVN